MFDIGWSEMAFVALIALIVIGPKELPAAMRTVAKYIRKARAITGEFQSSFNEMVREAELDEAKKALESADKMNPAKTFAAAVDPTGSVDETLSEVEKEIKKDDPAVTIHAPPTPAAADPEPAAPPPAAEPEPVAAAPAQEPEPLAAEAVDSTQKTA